MTLIIGKPVPETYVDPGSPMKKILVPTDFSLPSEAAFSFAAELAMRSAAALFVLHAIELPLLAETTFGIQPPPHDPAFIARCTASSKASFERLRNLAPVSIPIHFATPVGKVLSSITSFIRENKIDQVVMSTHGASRFSELILGSTAEKVIRHVSVPVLAIPRPIEADSVKRIVFPNLLEPGQDDLVERISGLQKYFNASIDVLTINTAEHYFTKEELAKRKAWFARRYPQLKATFNIRTADEESAGIAAFVNEVGGDVVAMATHGRKGIPRLIMGSVAESVLNAIDRPLWAWKIPDK